MNLINLSRCCPYSSVESDAEFFTLSHLRTVDTRLCDSMLNLGNREMILTRLVWSLLAPVLVIACLQLAVYNLHHTWSITNRPLPFNRNDTYQHVKWMRLGGPEITGSSQLEGENSSYFDNCSSKNQQPLLKTVSRSFQEQLLSGLPLSSFPGPEGLFRPKYDQFLNTLLEYANNYSKMRSSPSSYRILTWYCSIHESCGGLGDRMRGVAYALLLAMFSNRRLVVFWEYSLDGIYLDPHMINWRDDKVYNFLREGTKTDSQVQRISIRSKPSYSSHILGGNGLRNDVGKAQTEHYMKLIGSSFSHVIITTNLEPSSLIDPERSGNQEWVKSGLEWSGLSHLSPSDLDDIVGVAFRYLFRIKDSVLGKVQEARKVLGLYSPYAALHVRTGFAGMQHEEYFNIKLDKGVSKWQSALRCAIRTADRVLGKDSLIFLATDSNRVKDIAVEKYGQRICTLGNTLIHVDRFHGNVDARVKEGALVVWVEFLLLAQSKVLIKGVSGYS